MIFTLICNDRNGARELHSYYLGPRLVDTFSQLCLSLSPLSLYLYLSFSLASQDREHRFENTASAYYSACPSVRLCLFGRARAAGAGEKRGPTMGASL